MEGVEGGEPVFRLHCYGGGTCLIKGEERKRKKEMSSISSCIQTLRTQLVN